MSSVSRVFRAAVTGLVLFGVGMPAWAAVVDVTNTSDGDIDATVGAGNSARLIGPWFQNWSPYNINSSVDLNGFTLTDHQGGNPHTWWGALSGTGVFISTGPALTLAGSDPNTFAGTYRPTGTLVLGKPAGTDAVNGTVELNASSMQWNNSDQVNDLTAILMTGAGSSGLLLNGRTDTVGVLTLGGSASIDMGAGGTGSLRFADSSGASWDSTKFVKIDNWSTSSAVNFGGLTAEQLALVYFKNPAGYDAGYYTAQWASGTSGAIVPGVLTSGPAVYWSGYKTNPTLEIGAGSDSRLSGDGTFGWQTGNCSIPVDLNGYNFTVDNGGGNYANVRGALTGQGNVTFVGRGDLGWEGSDNWIGGATPNTYSGATLVRSGWLQLNKTAGVTAIPGDLQIGNGGSAAGVKLLQGDQIADTAVVTLERSTGANYGLLRMNGQNETVGGLQTSGTGDAYVENGSDTASVSTVTVNTADGTFYDFAGTLRDEPATAGKGSKLAFAKTGPGTQILSGPITHTGGTTVNGGTLTINSSLPSADLTVTGGTLNGLATIRFQNGDVISVTNSGTFDASGGMIWDLTSLTGASPLTLLDYNGGGTFTAPAVLNDLLAGPSAAAWSLSNAGGLVQALKVVAYAWNLDANGNWNSGTNWVTGVPNSVGGVANFTDKITAPRAVTVDAPVTVGLIKFDNANKYTVTGTSANAISLDTTTGNATIQLASGSHEIAAPMALNKTVDVTVGPSDQTLTISGAVSAGVAGSGLSKAGAGTLSLTGANTFDGPVSVNAGVLDLGGTNAFTTVGVTGATLRMASDGALASGAKVTINAGGSFDLNGTTQTIDTLTSSGSVVPNGGTLSLIGATKNVTLAGLSGAGRIVVTNKGVNQQSDKVSLGNNTGFTGDLQFVNSYVQYADGAGLGSATTVVMSGSSLNALRNTPPGTTFHITGSSSVSNWSGGPSFNSAIDVDAGVTFTIGTGGGNPTTLYGKISGEGNLNLEKAANIAGSDSNELTGVVTVLANSSTLSKTGGAIAIAGKVVINNAAVLQLSGAGEQIADTAAMTLKGTGQFRLNGMSETMGTLTVAGSGAIDMGNAGTSAVSFANSSAVAWGGILAVNGYVGGGDHLLFGTDGAGLTAAQVSQITFINPSGSTGYYSAQINGSGEVTPGVAYSTGEAEWANDASGSFGDTAQWVGGVAPNGPYWKATFGANVFNPQTITMAAPATVNKLYVVPASPVTLTIDGASPLTVSQNFASGAGEINVGIGSLVAMSAPLNVVGKVTATIPAGSSLTLSGAVGGGGTLRQTGGEIILSNTANAIGIDGTNTASKITTAGTTPIALERLYWGAGTNPPNNIVGGTAELDVAYMTHWDSNGVNTTGFYNVSVPLLKVTTLDLGDGANRPYVAPGSVMEVKDVIQTGTADRQLYVGGSGGTLRLTGHYAGLGAFRLRSGDGGNINFEMTDTTVIDGAENLANFDGAGVYGGRTFYLGGPTNKITNLSANPASIAGRGLNLLGSKAIFEGGDLSVGGAALYPSYLNAASVTLTVNGATTLTLTGPLKEIGTGRSLVKDGPGTLVLSGIGTYTGTTTIAAGTLRASSLDALGAPLLPVVLGGAESSGTLAYTGGDATISRGFNVDAGGGRIDVTTSGKTLTIDTIGIAPWAGSGGITFGGDGNVGVLAEITAGPLVKTGAGTLTLGALNSYTGGTTVSGGRLVVADIGALPAGGSLTISAGGTVVLSSGLNAASGNGSGFAGATPVPEPSMAVLLLAGAAALLIGIWRRRK